MTGKEALKAMIDGEKVCRDGKYYWYIKGDSIKYSETHGIANRTFRGFMNSGEEFSIYKEPEHVFEPFEQVLVRDGDDLPWAPSHYGWENEKDNYQYHCGFSAFNQCIPYKGNEHLLGTSDNA